MHRLRTGLLFLAVLSALPAQAQTRTLRIVTYNVSADIGLTNSQPTFTNAVSHAAAGAPLPGLIAPPTNSTSYVSGGALEGIGEELVNGNAQPIDILALQETSNNSVTVAPIVNALNTFYGVPGMFTNSTYQATESGNNATFGNGPNAMIYNTRMVQLVASTPVDPPGGTGQLGGVSSGRSGMYREVMRYQFAPAGVATNASNIFFVYVSHYKSGAGTTANNTNSRAGEAFIVRSNMVTTLPTTARILHVGDFNTGEASELMYAILTAPGTNQLVDPLNPLRDLTTNFDGSLTPQNLTYAPDFLLYRDDYQMMTTNVFYGKAGGLMLVPGSYHVFGNNGSVAYTGSMIDVGNTAFSNRLITNGPVFINAAQLYIDLTGASDHLPVVADYTIPLPAPRISNYFFAGNNLALSVTNGVTNAVYHVLMSTNLLTALSDWIPVATTTAAAGNFSITASNVLNPSSQRRFFVIRGK